MMCPGMWDGHRCERPYGHEPCCWSDGIAWTLGPNIIVNLDGPATATSQGYSAPS